METKSVKLTPQELLLEAIQRSEHGSNPSPKNGPIVVSAYEEGRLDHEMCLYVIAHILDMTE